MIKNLTLLFMLLCSLFVQAQEGEISEVVFQENNRTKTTFLKKLVSVLPGQVLDSTALQDDVIRLKRLPSTSHAYFQVHPKEDGSYKVVYGVQENFTIIPSANVFTSNDDEFAFRVGLFEFNALGRNITIGGIYQYDVFNSYGINFRAPYLFSKHLGLALNHNNLTSLEPVFFDNTSADYKYNNTSFEILGLYEFNRKHRIETGINYFTETYEYRSGATNPNVPLELEVKKLLYKGIYQYNDVDTYYQYINGFRSTLNVQYVTSTQETLPEFVIFWNDFEYFLRIGDCGNWASRLRMGLASNSESPFAPFAVDNNLNIRGVGNTIDRGTGVIVLNTEYRHTLIDKNWFVLQGNAFVDAGSWRNPGGEFSDFGDSQNIRIYPGFGVRFIHKRIFNTVFRIDYGHGVTQDATRGFVFGIGQYF